MMDQTDEITHTVQDPNNQTSIAGTAQESAARSTDAVPDIDIEEAALRMTHVAFHRLVAATSSWPSDSAADVEDAFCEVQSDVKTLRFDNADDVSAAFVELRGAMCKEVRTRGDGACAVHAAFGQSTSTQIELQCLHPRRVLRTLFDQPIYIVRASVRPSQRHLLEAVVSSL